MRRLPAFGLNASGDPVFSSFPAKGNDVTTAAGFLAQVLVPALTWLETILGPLPPNPREARLELLVIPGQESLWSDVEQWGGGPGRGYYQDEPETCSEVLNNPTSAAMMHKVCAALGIEANGAAIYGALLGNTKLQVAIGRLDMWCDPRPLPPYGNVHQAWLIYDEEWRPGAPHPALWDGLYAQALAADQAWEAAQIKPPLKP